MLINVHIPMAACIALWVGLVAGSAAAADDAALRKDLTSAIALLGLPCGQVINVTPLKDDDHIATCRDGQRYRVFIDPAGRVVAQQLKP